MSSANSKRHRTPSLNSISSTSTTETLHPSKASRIVPGQSGSAESAATSHPLVCTLPPTCNHRPTPLASSRDMEIHYATYHAHVCEQGGCGAVFPEPRFLELHQTECHDPLAAVRKDRGEKIFGCLLANCPRLFSTPKTRRLHLIQAHGYPKEFFFAVTNKGIGGLLKRWGEGVSMIRGEWKPRSNGNEAGDGDDDEENEDQDEEEEGIKADDGSNIDAKGSKDQENKEQKAQTMSVDEALETLTSNLDSLSLVPPSIRFGRGGKKGGFLQSPGRGFNALDSRGIGDIGRRGRGRGGVSRSRGRGGIRGMASMDIDVNTEAAHPPSAPAAMRRGRGGSGIDHPRGRGGPFRGRKFRDDGA